MMLQTNHALRWALTLASTGLLVGSTIGIEGLAKADPWQGAPHMMIIERPPNLPDVRKIIKQDPFASTPITVSIVKNTLSNQNGQNPNLPVTNGNGTSIVGVGNTSDLIPTFRSGVTPTSSTVVPNPGSVNIPQFNGSIPSGVGPQGSVIGQIYVIATIISGDGSASALLKNGNTTDVVKVGDYIGSSKIIRIVEKGIEFSDGSRIAVSPAPNDISVAESMPKNSQGTANSMTMPTSSDPNTLLAPSAAQSNANQAQSSGNGAPTIDRAPYQFGPASTPVPGTTPAPVPRYYNNPNVQNSLNQSTQSNTPANITNQNSYQPSTLSNPSTSPQAPQ